jgi:hypothetical protein
MHSVKPRLSGCILIAVLFVARAPQIIFSVFLSKTTLTLKCPRSECLVKVYFL